MLVGLLSDTHDNEERTRAALSLLQEAGVQHLLHAGDLATGRLVPLLAGWMVHLAEGNVDDASGIQEAVTASGAEIRYARVHELELGAKRVGLIHGDDGRRLEGMINSGAFDLVVHGHTHTFRDERVGSTRVVNPGAVHRASPPSVCTYDPGTDVLERLEL